MIKASSTVQTGNIGELAIGYQFTKLNWHVAPNPAGEVGTDVFCSRGRQQALILVHSSLVR